MTHETDFEMFNRSFAYDAGTGVMTWRERSLMDFAKEGAAKMWNKRYAGKVAGRPNSTGHIQVRIDGRLYYTHRIAWLLTHGNWPTHQIDHINGVTDDNRIANIREVTATENAHNRRKPRSNTSGVLGVRWRKRVSKWQAQIVVNKKYHYLGLFDTIDEAAAARLDAEGKFGFHKNHGRG